MLPCKFTVRRRTLAELFIDFVMLFGFCGWDGVGFVGFYVDIEAGGARVVITALPLFFLLTF